MIRIFHGDDRVKIQSQVEQILGNDYEVLDGENLTTTDLDSIFLGNTLFATDRRILIKDLSINPDCFAKLPNYAATTHNVVIWEAKLDKRTLVYKDIVTQKIEITEQKLAEPPEKKQVFDIFDQAWQGNSQQAIALIEKIETTNDPYMFLGLITSQAIKKLESNGNQKATKTLKLLSKTDLNMKTTSLNSWLLIKTLILQISTLK